MQFPIHIRFHGMEASDALTTTAHVYANGLNTVDAEIIACWVGIRMEPAQPQQRRSYSVRIDVKIPGQDFVTQRVQHYDVYLALNDAFDNMRHQLQEVEPHQYDTQYAVTVPGDLDSLGDTQWNPAPKTHGGSGRQPHM